MELEVGGMPIKSGVVGILAVDRGEERMETLAALGALEPLVPDDLSPEGLSVWSEMAEAGQAPAIRLAGGKVVLTRGGAMTKWDLLARPSWLGHLWKKTKKGFVVDKAEHAIALFGAVMPAGNWEELFEHPFVLLLQGKDGSVPLFVDREEGA